jgi:6,7-dimethyl-8-ribityllumazine synthase
MSTDAPLRPDASARAERHFAIVASKFNARFVQGLVNHATEELRNLRPAAAVTLHEVPGAFEIPVVARELAARGNVDAILALGVIIQGHTSHAEHLAVSVTNALQQIAIEYGVPVINAVLSVETEEQARERCLEKRINRGVEAARAAAEVADVISTLREQ